MKKIYIQLLFVAITSTYCIAQNGPQLRRIEGQGNDGLVLDFVAGMHDSILAKPNSLYNYPLYDNNKGPVYVDIYNPLLTPPGDYQIIFNGALDTAKWKLVYLPTNTTVPGDSMCTANYVQDIPQWGMKIRTTLAPDPGNSVLANNGFLQATMIYSDTTKKWLGAVPDSEGINQDNWIRSGTYKDPMNYQYEDYATNQGQDDIQAYEKVLGGTWAPYRLCAHTIPSGGLPYIGGPAWDNSLTVSQSKMQNLASVDIVITSDKSKWTRCPVLELQENSTLAIGGASKLEMRRSASVDKNGLANFPSAGNNDFATGMGWFPGYAVNLETGERLNMAFGEDSWLSGENGSDMLWNPTSTVSTTLGSDPIYGGKHYIYVFEHNADQIFSPTDAYMPGKLKDIPCYDAGKAIHDLLATVAQTYPGTQSDGYKREVFIDAMWVNIPLLKQGHSLLETDVNIRLRVSKKYRKYGTGTSVATGSTLIPFANYFVESGTIIYNSVTYITKTSFVANNLGTAYTIYASSNPNPPSVLTTINVANPMYIFNTGSLVGIKENHPENNFSNIYPNPASNTINIKYKTSEKNYSIKIYDACGRMVKNIEHLNSAEVIINIEDLSDGIYLLNVYDGKNSSVKRFVKQ